PCFLTETTGAHRAIRQSHRRQVLVQPTVSCYRPHNSPYLSAVHKNYYTLKVNQIFKRSFRFNIHMVHYISGLPKYAHAQFLLPFSSNLILHTRFEIPMSGSISKGGRPSLAHGLSAN